MKKIILAIATLGLLPTIASAQVSVTNMSDFPLPGNSSFFAYGLPWIMMIFMVVCFWRVFEKAGQAGWKSIIPIYNFVIMCRIGGLSPWLVLLLIVPFVNFFVAIYIYHALSKSFGKSGWFTAGLILLSPIFFGILAFDHSTYLGPANHSNFFGEDQSNQPGQSGQPSMDTTASATDTTASSVPVNSAPVPAATPAPEPMTEAPTVSPHTENNSGNSANPTA